MDRSARSLFNRWDSGPVSAALDARLPGRASGPAMTQRADLTADSSSSWDSLRSTLSRVFSSSPITSRNIRPLATQTRSSMFDGSSEWGGSTGASELRSLGTSGFGTSNPMSSVGSTSSLGAQDWGGTGILDRFHAQSQGRIQATAMQRAMEQAQPQTGGAAVGGMGSPNSSQWARVNQWDSLVAQVSAATGVPANVIKSVMMIESQGVLDAMSPMTSSGNYFGLMQIGATSSVPEYMKSQAWLRGSAYNQILAGATELRNKYAAIKAQNWTQAADAYFGYGTDVTGTTTQGYMGAFNNYMNQLQAVTTSGGWSGQPGSGGALSTMFQGHYPSSSGWGFGRETGISTTYQYGRTYGTNGTVHTGLDVPMPLKSQYFAPADAVVTCVGCHRNDHITGGIGRVELTMPDGAKILYDHVYSSAVQVGQRVSAGQLLGLSGGMTYPHIHLEVRYPDASLASGYRLIDPEQYFSGMAGSPTFGGGGAVNPLIESATERLLRLMGR